MKKKIIEKEINNCEILYLRDKIFVNACVFFVRSDDNWQNTCHPLNFQYSSFRIWHTVHNDNTFDSNKLSI